MHKPSVSCVRVTEIISAANRRLQVDRERCFGPPSWIKSIFWVELALIVDRFVKYNRMFVSCSVTSARSEQTTLDVQVKVRVSEQYTGWGMMTSHNENHSCCNSYPTAWRKMITCNRTVKTNRVMFCNDIRHQHEYLIGSVETITLLTHHSKSKPGHD